LSTFHKRDGRLASYTYSRPGNAESDLTSNFVFTPKLIGQYLAFARHLKMVINTNIGTLLSAAKCFKNELTETLMPDLHNKRRLRMYSGQGYLSCCHVLLLKLYRSGYHSAYCRIGRARFLHYLLTYEHNILCPHH